MSGPAEHGSILGAERSLTTRASIELASQTTRAHPDAPAASGHARTNKDAIYRGHARKDVALACCFLLCDALAEAKDTVARLEGRRNELSA